VPPEEKETMIKKYKVFILGLVIACAPKPPELPKHYVPPELADDDLDVEEHIEMIEDLEEFDTAEPKAKDNK